MAAFVFIMLSKQEKDFLHYWETNRRSKKKFLRQFTIALPIGVLVVAVVFINLLSGWYEKADMEIRSNASLIPVIVIAMLLTVVFVTIFSARHKWEQNEQRYQELKKKIENESFDASKE